MKNLYICQTKLFKSYIVVPDDWSGIFRGLISKIIDIGGVFTKSTADYSLSKTILGPNRLFLHFNIRQLLQGEAEPSIDTTRDYFDGLSYRQNYFEPSTNTIMVLSKDHFTAKYYRINNYGAQYNKKYCLYIERLEYLITAVLVNVDKDQGRPNDVVIQNNETIYDDIVRSLYLLRKKKQN